MGKDKGEITVTLPGDATMEMMWIEPGTFVMGTTEEQEQLLRNKRLLHDYYKDEQPAHVVTITHGFWLGKYELTQRQWESVMGNCLSERYSTVQKGPDKPAVNISWEDVEEFVQRLNQKEGSEMYRLPTEAEWEYACRAGTTTQWSFGNDIRELGKYAWYVFNVSAAGKPYAHTVGEKLPNPWGLYDMYGNVYEWCQDWYGQYLSSAQNDPTGPNTGVSRVLRGGCFASMGMHMRSASRYHDSPSDFNHDTSVRLLRHELKEYTCP